MKLAPLPGGSARRVNTINRALACPGREHKSSGRKQKQ